MPNGKGMGPKHAARTKFAKEKRKADASELYLQGKTQAEIAEVLGANQKTISANLREVAQQFERTYLENRKSQIEIQLEEAYWRRDELKREWERSKQDFKSVRSIREMDNNGQPASGASKAMMTKEDRLGDARYIQLLLANDMHIAKLLGLYKIEDFGGQGPEIPLNPGDSITIVRNR